MGINDAWKKFVRSLIFPLVVGIFIVVASGQGYCDIQFTGGLNPGITLPSLINVSPNPVYVGQTVTVKGTGWNTTPYPGDTYPLVACAIGSGAVIQPDGTWIIQSSYTGPGTVEVYAEDKWGHQSNVVRLTITKPPDVIFKATVYNGSAGNTDTNGGSVYLKYPASMAGHYENSVYGTSFIASFPYNGTTAEIWAVKGTRVSEHKTIQNIEPGKTYSVDLILPTPTPTANPTATTQATPAGQATPTSQPAATAQAIATPGSSGSPTAVPGAADTVAPVTVLNCTGLKDASGTFTSSVVCTLTATDNEGGSGVNATQYSFDGTNWTTYAGPFTVSAPDNYTIFFSSVDRAGNQEVAKVEAFSIVGTGSATTAGKQGSGVCAAMLLPLLIVGFAGSYRMRKRL